MQIVMAITFIGFALSVVGLVFEYPNLYQLGLKLSILLYAIILPSCLLLIVLFYLNLIYLLHKQLYLYLVKKRKHKSSK